MNRRKGPLNGRAEEFQVLFENVPAYIAVLDQNYRIVKANRYFTDTFGYQVGELCYHAYKGLQEKCRECPAEHTFREGTLQVNEEIGRSKDGREVCYLVYSAPIHDHRGRVRYALEMSLDLTQRKNLEKVLQANQDFLSNVIDNSFCGIVALDREGEVIVFNRSAERILGYESSQVIGSREVERFFPRGLCRKISSFLEGRAGKEILPASPQETWLRSKTEERVPVRFSVVGLSKGKSRIGAVGFFEDLRILKALEREKLQAERVAAVGQTVAGLVHGVKTIITGLEGGVFVVQTGIKRQDRSRMEKGWEMVKKNIEKISTLAKDLLSYSKERTPDLQWIYPNELVEEACSLFQEKACLSGIQIIQDLDSRLGLAQMDPQGIHACLTNLLSNAVDACLEDRRKQQYRVVVRTRREREGPVVFEVEDDGPGMTEEIRKKLFTGFFSTKGAAGTGLGLLVTHKIVREHGGDISVESQLNQGSLFRITIPQEEAAPPEEQPGLLGQSPSAR